jgi:hypothetical protein
VGNAIDVGVQSAVGVKVGLGVLVAGTGLGAGATPAQPATKDTTKMISNRAIDFLDMETNTSIRDWRSHDPVSGRCDRGLQASAGFRIVTYWHKST